ncbi:peptide ABC transporter substrate-binding protein [Roseibium aquae]|uniref:Peptide ABC transporter substrate-binding protein n=1 Tax=Roseibium aquae TaxID=1323746 RepID=A0A916TMV6_9HYPH|nr:ABC transporter substrate-binding protein [Roseibium aquae]GGB59988.1 peptide ABC transporter substrate-binding protein [Roseibium aquae]
MGFDFLRSATTRRTTSALVASAALAFALAPASAETIRWARVGDALTLDPHSQNEGPTTAVMHHIYETLVDREVDGTLEPRLATEWSIHPDDPTVWVFKLREGVKFHGGEDLTAEDVVFSVERVRHEASDFKGLHANVVGAEAIDDYTVHIKMDGPSPLYPNNLTNFFIMDKGWSEANDVVAPQNYDAGEEKFSTRNTNGTGPYKLISRDPEVRTVMQHFDGHWDEKPQVTEIIYTPIKEEATRVAALLSGEVDLVQDVPVQDIARLQNTAGINVTTGPENRVIFFAYDMGSDKLISANVDDNPFKKPEVREAMALALDRDAIMKVVMRGQSLPTGVAMPPFVNGWTEELDKYELPDVDKAKALLAEAGYPDGFSVDLNCPNDRYLNDEAICQAYVGMLGRIGINANLVSQSRSLHFPLISNRTTDFYLLGWGVPTFDSSYIFNFLVHTDNGTLGGWNGSRYSNPELDEMMQAIATEVDLEKRNEMIGQIWAQLQADRVLLPVHNQLLAYATREGVKLDVHPENTPKMTDVVFE